MLFNSLPFILLFLPLCVGVNMILRDHDRHLRVAWLCLCSLAFYGHWSPAGLILLIGSIGFNYAIHRLLAGPRGHLILAFGIAINLINLVYFKYLNFVVSDLLGIENGMADRFSIALPLGISFYTFTQIAFLVDCRRGRPAPTAALDYLLFVTYFPHLVAGPIIHHSEMIPQFQRLRRPSPRMLTYGVALFLFGLVKKIVLADLGASIADPVFAAVARGQSPDLFSAWSGLFAFSFQIYFDFSAYSDMALGLSLLFGIRLPGNFNSPYQARNIIDFWRRWHITLSRFLRDYLYIPLGGNRGGALRQSLNIMITMLIGGAWHGAGWGYILWGGIHGALICLNHGVRRAGVRALPTPVAIAATFVAVSLAWVPFRSTSLGEMLMLYGSLLWPSGTRWPTMLDSYRNLPADPAAIGFATAPIEILAELAALATVVWLLPNTVRIFGRVEPVTETQAFARSRLTWRPTLAWASATGLMAALAIVELTMHEPKPFIYFQF